jgi:hypothetical protein
VTFVLQTSEQMKNFTSLLLIICTCCGMHSYAQTVPNGGFETWTNMGAYSDPDNWATSNMVMANTVEKGTPGASGNAYIKIHNDSAAGMGKVPGYAITARSTGFVFLPAFPVTTQVACLEGKYQCHITGKDTAAIGIMLTNSSTGSSTEVGSNGMLLMNVITTGWTDFSIPIIYSGTPDSALIMLFAAIGDSIVVGNYLYIDDLHFCAPAAVEAAVANPDDIIVYPNPASDELHVLGAPDGAFVRIVNNVGQVVYTRSLTPSIDVTNFIPGLYFISVVGERGDVIKVTTFIKQ